MGARADDLLPLLARGGCQEEEHAASADCMYGIGKGQRNTDI